MTNAQLILLISTIVAGIGVLISYYVCFFVLFKPQSYLEHELWFGMPKSYRIVAVCFQILAIIGFLRMFFYLMSHTADTGILSYKQSHMTWIIMLLFLIPSAIWPIVLFMKQKILTVLCLLMAAIACVLMLAGCVEANFPVDVMLSAFALNIVCVLQDAVMWNAAYILHD